MLAERGLCLLNLCRTRNTAMLFQSAFTTIGIRELVSENYLILALTEFGLNRDALMEECVRMMQQNMRESPSIKKRAKSVYNQRNLGTIKERKKEKKEQKEVSNGETIMRILRMRYIYTFLLVY